MILNYLKNHTLRVGVKKHFLSIEDKNEESIAGFLRFRIPSPNHYRPEITDKTALIRELHVYGNMIKIGGKKF